MLNSRQGFIQGLPHKKPENNKYQGAVSIVPFNRPETTIKAGDPAEMTTKENKFIIVISQLNHLLPQIDVSTIKKVTFVKLINQACNSVQNKKSPI